MKNVRIFLISLLFVGYGSAVAAQTVPAQQQEKNAAVQPSPENWLIQKGQELLDILSVSETKTRYVRLRRIAREVFNQKEMPRLAMGKHWKNLSEAQQEALRQVFFDYFVVTYGSFEFKFSNVSFRVVEKILSGKDILLRTKVDFQSGGEQLEKARKMVGNKEGAVEASSKRDDSSFEILFALRQTENGFYIRDAKFEGQSVIMFLRDSLNGDYRAVSYDTDKFLNKMRQTINSRYRAAEDLAKAKTKEEM
ncbi:MAG: ABC transporter substrate-binding protein [Alphaproteobacteria bacterium]|nr:ABC transporter substrate-binding protein [Alphaproteobacteria bacterium]